MFYKDEFTFLTNLLNLLFIYLHYKFLS